ncbi:hypothetical protein VTN49DRAFT_3094 [Thermomyces lanuginosus]|uniref:uncharacterized protein n=1 Tax=Thermomyces lanuginosus TaxID=5541 RepID=UPI003742B9CC
MKLLTKEEEAAHYREVLRGGTIGTALGLVGGVAGVLAASRRYHTIRNLTLPMKTFLVTSSGTFFGIIAADHASRTFEANRNLNVRYLEDREERRRREELAHMTFRDRAFDFLREEKYKIIGLTWVASIIGSFMLVGRNPYLTGQQKIVQARVYAQGLTLAVLCATAAFEISDQRRGQGIAEAVKSGRQAAKETSAADRSASGTTLPHNHSHGRSEVEDLWKDMVAAEEAKLKMRHRPVYEHEAKEANQAGEHASEGKGSDDDGKEETQ